MNQTPIEKQKGTFRKCIVAFVDVLGSKAILCSEDENKIIDYVNSMNGIYDKIRDRFSSFFIKTFSDNILIYSEDYSEGGILAMINSVAYIQYEILCEFGLMVRGGIVIDDLHWNNKADEQNNDFVIGKSIVRAFDLESKKSIYPRILLSRTDFSTFFQDQTVNDCIVCDSDGNMYIDYLQVTLEEGFPNNAMIKDHADALKKHIELDLLNYEYISDQEWDKIKSKDIWVLCYHNDFCRRRDASPELEFTERFNNNEGRVTIKFIDDISTKEGGITD